MNKLLLLLTLFTATSIAAQITVDRKQHQFGTLKGDMPRYTDFTFTNKGSKDAFILRVKPETRDVVFSIEKTYLTPGESARIRLMYNPKEEGSFTTRVNVFNSESDKPIVLKLTGTTKDLYDLKRMQCPDFSATSSDKRKSLEIPVQVLVMSTATRLPIERADVVLAKSEREFFKLRTDKDGYAEDKIPLGLYGVNCEASGHKKVVKQAYFKRGQQTLEIWMDPLEGNDIIADNRYDLPQEAEPKEEIVEEVVETETIEKSVTIYEEEAEVAEEVESDEVELETEELVEETPTEEIAEVRKEVFLIEPVESEPIEEVEENEEVIEETIEKTVFIEEEFEEPEVVEKPIEKEEVAIETAEPVEETPIFVENPEFKSSEYKRNNIVFLIDRSVSMKHEGKLDLLKAAMYELLDMLRPIDQLTVVMYNDQAEVLIPTQPVADKQVFKDKIDPIVGVGRTFGAKGLREAYDAAQNQFIPNGNNVIFLATDGAFKEGSEKLKLMAMRYARKDIHLSVIGVKNGTWTEEGLRNIAEKGEGSYVHLETENDAQLLLKEEIKKRSLINEVGQ